MSLREGSGEPDRGLPVAAAAPLRCRLDGDAGEPGRQDVFVAPRAVVRVYVIEDEAMDAAVAARPSCARRRRSIGPRRGDGGDTQSNLATTYDHLGRLDEALSMRRDIYFGFVKIHGEEHRKAILAANNYANALIGMQRFEEAKALMRTTVPVARRVSAENDELTLHLRWNYAQSLYLDSSATLDDFREAVTTLEEASPIARRVLGIAHPNARGIELCLQEARAALRAHEA